MAVKDLNKKYAVAFVHTPSGEVGRTEFVFDRLTAQNMCKELDGICETVLHFVLAQGDSIRVGAEQRRHGRQ